MYMGYNRKGLGGRGGLVLITRVFFLFTARWVYNRGAYEQGRGGGGAYNMDFTVKFVDFSLKVLSSFQF